MPIPNPNMRTVQTTTCCREKHVGELEQNPQEDPKHEIQGESYDERNHGGDSEDDAAEENPDNGKGVGGFIPVGPQTGRDESLVQGALGFWMLRYRLLR